MNLPPPGFLGPRERLTGNGVDRRRLLERLTDLRAPGIWSAHPDLAFASLPAALRLPWIDERVFKAGLEILADRYSLVGITRFLPPARVLVGVRSITGPRFGGFHHPDQGYRHLRSAAITTAYGDLTGATRPPGALTALDLLRTYAHDCLHFATFRRYRITGGEIVRTHYGINARGPDGRPRSRRDGPAALSTRNLGILMEGATDRVATSIVRTTAERCGITRPERGIDRLAFGDATGRLDPHGAVLAVQDEEGAYLSRLRDFHRTVTVRYAATLRELGGDEHEALHRVVVSAMVPGELQAVADWLERRHGRGAFADLFGASTGR